MKSKSANPWSGRATGGSVTIEIAGNAISVVIG
jgi:hypothetical protein